MQKLDAVNFLLSLLGSAPVGDLTSPHPVTQTAINRLDAASFTIQKKGWWFNKEYHWVIQPDATTKELILPAGVIAVTVESRNAIIKRGNKLYDTIQHTYQFDAQATMNLTFELEWDYLDDIVQDAIQFFAGVQVCEFDLEDSLKASKVEKFYTDSLVDMKKTDLKTQRRNILDSPASARLLRGVRPYNKRSGGNNPLLPGG